MEKDTEKMRGVAPNSRLELSIGLVLLIASLLGILVNLVQQ